MAMMKQYLVFVEISMALNNYREKQRALGNTEIRGIFCKTDDHKLMKQHIKHILRLKGEGLTNDDINNRLARGHLED